MTISIDRELSEYLRSRSNVSSTIAEAVEVYRTLELERSLADAYQKDAEEAEQINSEWSVTDSELEP